MILCPPQVPAVVDPAWNIIQLNTAHRDKLITLNMSKSVSEDLPEMITTDPTRRDSNWHLLQGLHTRSIT